MGQPDKRPQSEHSTSEMIFDIIEVSGNDAASINNAYTALENRHDIAANSFYTFVDSVDVENNDFTAQNILSGKFGKEALFWLKTAIENNKKALFMIITN
jgi:hypothetical protein